MHLDVTTNIRSAVLSSARPSSFVSVLLSESRYHWVSHSHHSNTWIRARVFRIHARCGPSCPHAAITRWSLLPRVFDALSDHSEPAITWHSPTHKSGKRRPYFIGRNHCLGETKKRKCHGRTSQITFQVEMEHLSKCNILANQRAMPLAIVESDEKCQWKPKSTCRTLFYRASRK